MNPHGHDRADGSGGAVPGEFLEPDRAGSVPAEAPAARATPTLPRAGVTYGQPDPQTDADAAADAAPTTTEAVIADIAAGPASGRTPASKTQKSYARRARQLLARGQRELGGAADAVTGSAFLQWLIAQKPSWKATSWRQNKAALCHVYQRSIEKLTERCESDPVTAARIAARIAAISLMLEGLQAEGSSGCAAESDQTSATKLKALPEADRLAITAALARGRSRHAEALADYLLAGVRTGLRPVEWAGTRRLPDDGSGALVLRVPNAKAGPVRGHGPFRTLTFTGLPAEETAIILRWLDRVRAEGDGADALLTALGDLLYVTTRRLWPRRRMQVALYSTRHAFAATAKLFYDAAEVAALMGHASDETATRHYGRYRAGRALPPELQALREKLPKPDPDEVGRIRRRLAESRARLAAMRERMQADAAPPRIG